MWDVPNVGRCGLEGTMGAVLPFVFLPPDASPRAVEEFGRLAGTWEVVEEECDGKAVGPGRAVLPAKVRFADEMPRGIARRGNVYTVVLDPGVNPPRLAATVAGGDFKGDRLLAIYLLDGDRLILRMAPWAENFPDGFETAEDDGTFILRLRRAAE
jgi:uncharacterized protein (TIGR03067 family)